MITYFEAETEIVLGTAVERRLKQPVYFCSFGSVQIRIKFGS